MLHLPMGRHSNQLNCPAGASLSTFYFKSLSSSLLSTLSPPPLSPPLSSVTLFFSPLLSSPFLSPFLPYPPLLLLFSFPADPLSRRYLLVTKSCRSAIHTQTHTQPCCSFSVCDLEALMSLGDAANVQASPDEEL